MVENRGEMQLDPTPNFDCHVSKSANIDVMTVTPQHAYESTQVSALRQDDVLRKHQVLWHLVP